MVLGDRQAWAQALTKVTGAGRGFRGSGKIDLGWLLLSVATLSRQGHGAPTHPGGSQWDRGVDSAPTQASMGPEGARAKAKLGCAKLGNARERWLHVGIAKLEWASELIQASSMSLLSGL